MWLRSLLSAARYSRLMSDVGSLPSLAYRMVVDCVVDHEKQKNITAMVIAGSNWNDDICLSAVQTHVQHCRKSN